MRKLFIVPHFHFDAIFLDTYENYLAISCDNILFAMELLRKHPSYRFVLDQTTLIGPFLDKYPELLDEFRQYVKEGRLEIVCGMYVMPDTNMISGESMLAQIMRGQDEISSRLGVQAKIGWMIDVFGHHRQIPQIFSKCGFQAYVFGRVAPKDSPLDFWWVGQDGSRLRCHWMPYHYTMLYPVAPTYPEFEHSIENVLHLQEGFRPLAVGMGLSGTDFSRPDGNLVTHVQRYNSTHDTQLVIATPSEYFQATADCDLPAFSGELNPVYKGCYSARSEVKRQNRLMENEVFSVNALLAVVGTHFSEHSNTLKTLRAQIADAKDCMLFNQFHDIICGTHVDKANLDVMHLYRKGRDALSQCEKQLMDILAAGLAVQGEGVHFTVFNPSCFVRRDIVEVEIASMGRTGKALVAVDEAGAQTPVQVLAAQTDGDGAYLRAHCLFVAKDVPACGYKVYTIIEEERHVAPIAVAATGVKYWGGFKLLGKRGQTPEITLSTLATEHIRLAVSMDDGTIKSLVFKGVEYISSDQPYGNTVVKQPSRGELWEYNAPCKGAATSIRSMKDTLPQAGSGNCLHDFNGDGSSIDGEVAGIYRFAGPFGNGRWETEIRVYAELDRIDVRSRLVNNDEFVRYRVLFPTTLKPQDVLFEIPFGTQTRPVNEEYPCMGYVDIMDGEKGMAVLNRGIHGASVVDGVIALSLMNCCGLNGHEAQGGHEMGVTREFEYALLPHVGKMSADALCACAQEYNQPLRVRKLADSRGHHDNTYGMVQVQGALCTSVEMCGQGIRLHLCETGGEDRPVALICGKKPVRAVEESFNGQHLHALEMKDGRIMLTMGAHEIKNIRVEFCESEEIL